MASSGTALGIVSAHFRLVHKPSDQELRRLDLYLRQVSDFIQRCSMEDALRRSEEALREADHRKDEFLALLAHELRNPLAPIRYALATNRSGSQTAEQRQRAEAIIDRQVAHMSRLLDDLLDVSRITRGMLELKRSPTDLASVVAAAIETARPLLDARRHALSVELPQPPAQIDADTVRLAQVFSNLLINAAKYTDPGGKIQLRATRTDKEIIVSVRDNGIGISSDMMPRLFRIFSQARSALDRAEGGLGIGLSLVRGLTSLHGGSVEAHSDGPGKGSEFVVRLPLGEPAEPLADRGTTADCSKATADALAATRDLSMTTANGSVITADDPAAARLKILVVDDNRDAADSCAAMLEAAGHRVAKTYSGQRALELGETFHPDAFLLDIGLPDLDGYELARKIRSLPWGRSTVLIAVTGWGQDEHRRRALAAGFDRHLTKPIAPEALSCLLQLLAPMR